MRNSIHLSKRRGFTLVEIMLVVAIIAMLATLAIPNYLRARKRSQAARMLDDLKAVDNALDIYATEFRRVSSDPITDADVDFLRRYVKNRTLLHQSLPNDLFGNEIVMTDFRSPPKLSIESFNSLSDVAPEEFWKPYAPE